MSDLDLPRRSPTFRLIIMIMIPVARTVGTVKLGNTSIISDTSIQAVDRWKELEDSKEQNQRIVSTTAIKVMR